MTLSCLTLVIPAAYHGLSGGPNGLDYTESGLLIISRGTAVLLLIVYVAYLFFQLKTHSYLFVANEDNEEKEEAKMSIAAAGSAYVYPLNFPLPICRDIT